MNKRVKQVLQTLFFLGIGVLLVWFQMNLLSNDQRQEVGNSFSQANYFWLFLSMATAILSHYLRALRWKFLLKAAHGPVRTSTAFYAVMIGFLANMFVPRLGEVLKCGLVSKTDGIPIEKAIGTVFAERLVDLLFLILIVGLTILVQFSLINEFLQENFFSRIQEGWASNSTKYILILLGIILTTSLGYWLLTKLLSESLSLKIKKLKNGLLQGAKAVFTLKERIPFLLYSVGIWICYFFMSYWVFFALKSTSHLGFQECLTVLTSGSLGMLVPTPGGLGSYHALVAQALGLFGIDAGVGVSYSWLVWLSQFVVLVLVGLLSVLLLSRTKKIQQ